MTNWQKLELSAAKITYPLVSDTLSLFKLCQKTSQIQYATI